MPRALAYLNGVLPSVLPRAAGARSGRDNFSYPELNHDGTQSASHTTPPTLGRLSSPITQTWAEVLQVSRNHDIILSKLK